MQLMLPVLIIFHIAVTYTATTSDVCPTHTRDSSSPSIPCSSRERRQRQIIQSIQQCELNREKILRDSKLAGKTTESNVAAVNYRSNLRRVNFKWQRGIKIGNLALLNFSRNTSFTRFDLRFKQFTTISNTSW